MFCLLDKGCVVKGGCKRLAVKSCVMRWRVAKNGDVLGWGEGHLFANAKWYAKTSVKSHKFVGA